MKRIKNNTRDQGVLFSEHYVGDRLSPQDEVFLFERLFDTLDISEITKKYNPKGGSMFAPKDQLAVILFAFHKGITSSVKMAELIRYNLQFIYLAGFHLIKRRTISDFRLKHVESIRKLLNSTTQVALDAGLISPEKIFALDGSKIEAHASFAMTRKKHEWKERQKQIIAHVDKFLNDWAEQDKLEENAEEEELERFNKISEKLKTAVARRIPDKKNQVRILPRKRKKVQRFLKRTESNLMKILITGYVLPVKVWNSLKSISGMIKNISFMVVN